MTPQPAASKPKPRPKTASAPTSAPAPAEASQPPRVIDLDQAARIASPIALAAALLLLAASAWFAAMVYPEHMVRVAPEYFRLKASLPASSELARVAGPILLWMIPVFIAVVVIKEAVMTDRMTTFWINLGAAVASAALLGFYMFAVYATYAEVLASVRP